MTAASDPSDPTDARATAPAPVGFAEAQQLATCIGWLMHRTRGGLVADALFLGAALAASVVTFFTFLPSFLFIPAGGAVVESTHGPLKFTALLTVFIAAVVGVILNLALFRFEVGVIPLLVACAAAGLIVTFLAPGVGR